MPICRARANPKIHSWPPPLTHWLVDFETKLKPESNTKPPTYSIDLVNNVSSYENVSFDREPDLDQQTLRQLLEEGDVLHQLPTQMHDYVFAKLSGNAAHHS